MAWTTPRTWVTNETLTATLLNTHVRDNLDALYGAPTTYTPQVDQGASTNISKTVNEARYIQTGRIVDVWVSLTMSAGGTSGSAITITLPVTASGHAANMVIGEGYIGQATNRVGAFGLVSSTTVGLVVDGQTNYYGATPSVALASTNVIYFHVRYVVA